jgi:Uma2 family endonuclease
MDLVVTDPIAALFTAGEGRFEWERGSLLCMDPVSDEHGEESGFLYSVMSSYAQEEDAGRVKADGYAEKLDEDTVRVPDVAFFRKSSVGRMKPTHSEGGADLVVEIVSPESRNRDRGQKFFEYERAGVEEYWIVDPERKRAEFYRLREGAYEPVLPDADGKIHSSTLPGFFLRVEWLWNRPKTLDALRELGVV